MFDNLRFAGATVDPRTSAGKIAVKVLDLNDPKAVDYREFVINAVTIAEEKRAQLLAQQHSAEQRAKKGIMPQAMANSALAEIAAQLTKIDKILKRFSGEV